MGLHRPPASLLRQRRRRAGANHACPGRTADGAPAAPLGRHRHDLGDGQEREHQAVGQGIYESCAAGAEYAYEPGPEPGEGRSYEESVCWWCLGNEDMTKIVELRSRDRGKSSRGKVMKKSWPPGGGGSVSHAKIPVQIFMKHETLMTGTSLRIWTAKGRSEKAFIKAGAPCDASSYSSRGENGAGSRKHGWVDVHFVCIGLEFAFESR